jgi:riboflavin kinase/FMN adenylyltransferase
VKVFDRGLASWDTVAGQSTVTMGVFDGVHLGHRSLIERAFGHEGTKVVVTFDPHPVEVLAPGTPPRLITTLEERLELLGDLGTDLVAVLDLAEIRHLSPNEFVERVLIKRLNIAALFVGEEFHFGRNRAGDVAFLLRSGSEHGFDVGIVELLGAGDTVVSSSHIRELIGSGDVKRAARLLGSYYRMTNTVIDGDKRGRKIGFPTANLNPVDRKILPGDGVYATFATVDGIRYPAASNVGTRPTFGGGQRLVEAHLLDFDEDIYGKTLTVEFVSRLRPEQDFASVDELVAQMHDDVDKSRHLLGTVTG